MILEGPVFVGDYHRDVEQVAEILKMDFSGVYKNRPPDAQNQPPDSQPRTDHGLGDSVVYAVAANTRMNTTPGCALCPTAFASCSSP